VCIKLVTWNKSTLWCTVRKTSDYKFTFHLQRRCH